jgi:hypothetical protein
MCKIKKVRIFGKNKEIRYLKPKSYASWMINNNYHLSTLVLNDLKEIYDSKIIFIKKLFDIFKYKTNIKNV